MTDRLSRPIRTALYASSAPAITALLAVFAAPAAAHHSFAPHYDPDNIVTVSGVVTEFEFRNPHSFVELEVTNAGATETWTCETQSAGVLRRRGFDGQLFSVGEELSISGAAARRDSTGCRVYSVIKGDGSRLVFFGGEPSSQATIEEPDSEPANDGFFGHWLIVPGTGTLGPDRRINQHTGPNLFESQLTAAGRAATAQYNQITDDPALSCEPASPVRVWDDPGSPTHIEMSRDRIIIRHELMDAAREIRLDLSEHPDKLTPAPLGRSIGRLDGDTLIVETTAFSTGVLVPHPGILMSPDARMTERFNLDEAAALLHIDWVLEDPAFYSSPLIGEFTLAPTDLRLNPYNCVPE